MITLPDGRIFYACPDIDSPQATVQGFVDYLNQAEKSLLIADYSFNLPQLGTILPALKAKGVNVRLVIDKSQSKGKNEAILLKTLQTAGIDMVIGTSSDHKIMHNKFSIIDNKICQYGSWNYTTDASDEDNFYFIDPNPEVITALTNDWQKMYDWISKNDNQ
jgi:phosphatidylserine/phosphatidylglycerophosphate/cardiolipin synthase-like enzyme